MAFKMTQSISLTYFFQSYPILLCLLWRHQPHTITDQGLLTFAKREYNIMGELYIVSREIAAISEMEK